MSGILSDTGRDRPSRRPDFLPHRTAVLVLVEEVGLSAADVAVILDADVEDIACAVDSAWVEAQDLGTPPVEPEAVDSDAVLAAIATATRKSATTPTPSRRSTRPQDGVAAPAVQPRTELEMDAGTSGQDVPAGPLFDPSGSAPHPVPTSPSPSLARTSDAQKAPDQPARSTFSFGRVAVTVVAVAILGLGVAVFSDTGQTRHMSQGFNPLIAFLVVVGFLGIGLSLVFAGGSAVRMSEDATVPAEDAQ